MNNIFYKNLLKNNKNYFISNNFILDKKLVKKIGAKSFQQSIILCFNLYTEICIDCCNVISDRIEKENNSFYE